MSYEDNKQEIQRKITGQRYVYKFREFLYSLNRDIRQVCFRITREFLENELNNPELTVTERERIQTLLPHWNWQNFDTASTAWWSALALEHTKSLSLMTVIHMWIDDINIFDPDAFETSTYGER
jgi:hypothetical protein